LVTLANGRERDWTAIFAQRDIDHGRNGKTTFGAQTHVVFPFSLSYEHSFEYSLKLTT
jgi:hypothetical protein